MKNCAVLILGLFVAAGPATRASRPMWDGNTWDFDTISGTSENIGEAINKDVRRLTDRCRDLERDIAAERDRLIALRGKRLTVVHASADYKAKRDRADRVERDLAAARRDHNGVKSVSLSSELNHLRQDMAAMESSALASDGLVSESQSRAIADGKLLATFRESLDQARKWRGSMTDAIRNTLRFHGEMRRGKVGLLGPTKSVEPLRVRMADVAGERAAARAFDGTVIAYVVQWDRELGRVEQIRTDEVTLEPFVARVQGGMPDPKVAVEVLRVDEYPPASVVVGHFTQVELVAQPDDPISKLMAAIGDDALEDAGAAAEAVSAKMDDPAIKAVREKRLVVGMTEAQAKEAMGGAGEVMSTASGKKTIRWRSADVGHQFEYARLEGGKIIETWKK